jgi:C4-dicarboxylate transporter, DctM subunit
MISPVVIGWIGLIILFAVMATGIPIGLAMALVGFIGYVVIAGVPAAVSQIQTVPFSTVASYDMTLLPLFVLMGEIAFFTGLIRGAYETLYKWLGHLPGGLAMATIGGCAAFAAICGSSVACASTMTSIAYPEMKRFNYDSRLSTGSIAAGGTLGILIPPSTPMVIYALFAQVSIGKLFIGGVLPGLLLTALFMISIFIWAKTNPAVGPSGAKISWIERIKSIKDVWPVVILAGIILGGIWGGIITAMEAAGVGAFAAFVIGLITRKISWQNTKLSLDRTLHTTAMIFTILIGAMIFNYFIVMSGIPAQLAALVTKTALPAFGVLAVILLIYLILGCIMDTMAMTVLTLPIFLPILTNLGFDLIWFGIIFVIMCEMALITPPIGMNVFVMSGMVKEVPMYQIFRGIWPFLGCMVGCLILVIIFPQIPMTLVKLMIK